MKSKKIMPLMCLVIFQFCFVRLGRSQSDSGTVLDDAVRPSDTIWSMKIDPKLPPFRFHVLFLPRPEGQKLVISILDSRTLDTLQVIKGYRESLDGPVELSNRLDTVDINLDGYPDLSYVSWTGATGNRGFSFWLYDKATHKFVQNEAYSDLINPEVDYSTRRIHTWEKCGGGCYEYTVYRVSPDRPVPTAFLSLRPDESAKENERYKCSRGRFEGGKRVHVENFIGGPEVFKLPEVPSWWPIDK